MSGKQNKLLRKEARKILEQRMQNGQAQPQYSFQHLEQFIALCQMLTGQKPTTITLVDSFYNWFIQETQRHAETLGLKPGFKDDQPVFNGVKIMKKTEIVKPDLQTIQKVNNPPKN
jgi:hypothetical protein